MPIRNLADLVRRGAVGTAAAFRSLGRSIADLTTALRRRYGSEMQAPQQSVRALSNFAGEAQAAGIPLSPRQQTVPTNSIPSAGRASESTFRYTVDYSIRNRNERGQLTGDVVYHTFQYETGTQISYDEILSRLRSDISDITERGYGPVGFVLAGELFNQPLERFTVSLLYRG